MVDKSSQDVLFMGRALELAKMAQSSGEVPVGALAVLDGEIVGEGFNKPISNNDPSAHAEVVALRDAAKRLNNYRLPEVTLYVTLEPCAMCVGAMLHARVRRLVFGANDPKTGAVVSVLKILDDKSLNHRINYQGGILAPECSNILLEFFKEKRLK